MQWFYLHFPHLYGETWYDSFHSSQALAFIDEKGSVLKDVNPAAERAGVSPDMLVNTAFCMEPTLQVNIIDPHQAQQALLRVAKLAYRFSGWVGLESPNGLYLEVATMRQLFGSLAALREQVLSLFQTLQYTLQVAAAPTPKAAHLLARSGAALCVDQANLMAALARLHISCLDVSANTLERLQKLGLKTISDVIQLPGGELSYRVDGELVDYLNKVTGRQHWKPQPLKMPEHFYHKVELEQDVENLTTLLFPLTGAVKQYCQFMQHRCLLSQGLNIMLCHRQQPPTGLPIQLARADNRTDTWLYMLNQCIERVKLAQPVTGFVLKASSFEPIPPSSLALFSKHPGMQQGDETHGADHEQAKACLLNRLTGRIGASHIFFTGVSEDPRPEYQTVYSSQPVLSDLFSQPQTEMNEPLWLLSQPKPVAVQHYRILTGPLRLDTGWWDNQPAQRDYYIGLERRSDSPALHWLFRTTDKQWFIHGLFA